MKANELIVIATSTPLDSPGYRRDFLNCLCYPAGIPVLFSYRKRWIEQALLEKPLEELKGAKALIMFCDIPEQAGQDFGFLPLRFVRFEGFEPLEFRDSPDGNINIAVRFVLDRFVFPASNMEQQRAAWQNWVLTTQGNKYPRPKAHPEVDNARFVFMGRDFQEVTAQAGDTSWVTLSEQLAKAKTLEHCSFYRVQSIEAPSKNTYTPVTIEEYMRHEARVFKSGKTYRINMQFYRSPGKAVPSKILTPRVSTDSIKLSQPLTENIGSFSNASIIANCSRVYSSEIVTLVIEDTDDKEALAARAEFVILLKPAKWILPVVVIMLAVGTFASSITSESIKEISASSSWIGSYSAGIAFLLKAIGSFLVGLGAYLGFRKTPSDK